MTDAKRFISITLVFLLFLSGIWIDTHIFASSSNSEYNVVKEVLWNIDFEDETLDTSLSPYVAICASDGYPLGNPRGDSFRCHIGSEENSIEISGGALKLNPANTTEYVQTNEFFSTVSEGVAVFKYRVMVEDFNTSKYVFRLIYLDEAGKTWWSPQFYIKQNTSASSASFAVKGGTDGSAFELNTTATCKTNVWYNIEARINLEDNTFVYMLDSAEIARGTLGKDIASTVRVSIAPEINEKNALASPLWIDDILVYEATNVPAMKLGLFINSEASKRITAGELSANATFSPGFDGTDAVFALYRGSKLTDIKWIKNPVTDSASETVTDTVNFGYVDEGVTLKLIVVDTVGKIKPKGVAVVANNIGLSTEVIDTDTLISIFSDDSSVIEALNGKIGYHPDSGLLTRDGKKERSPFKGEKTNGTVMVNPKLLESFGATVSLSESVATVDGFEFAQGESTAKGNGKTVSLSEPPYIKNGELFIPLCDALKKVMGKSCYVTTDGANSGAVIAADTAFEIPDVDVQALNYHLLYERPSKEKVLSDYRSSKLNGVHPRVIMTKESFERVKNATDFKTVHNRNRIIAIADSYLNEDVLFYEIRDGVRLWYVSMDFMDRVMALAFAYRLTGDEKYLNKCTAEMDSIASFPTWHPEHHIDVGGLAVGFGIGYDWLYDSLTPEQKSRYESAVYGLCYDQYYKGFTNQSDYMKGGVLAVNNHNSVMNSGITICALAFMDAFPKEGAYFIENSLRATEVTVPNFAPDGAWYEGVGYGCMTLEYLALQLSALEAVFGNCYCLDFAEGMDMAARFVVNMQSPTGAFAFYDGGSTNIQWHSGALWFAEHFGDTLTVNEWYNHYNIDEDARATASFLMYYNPDSIYESTTTETRWDIDFENVYSAEHRWGYPYVSFTNSNGSLLSSGGDTLTAHAGSVSNAIEVKDTGDTKHKRALNLRAADSSQVQLNEFLASPEGDSIVYEFDYMVQAFPKGGNAYVMRPVLDGGMWLDGIDLSNSDGTPEFVLGSNKKEATPGTWYHIKGVADMARGKMLYYIDGSYFAKGSIPLGQTKGYKLSSRLSSASGASVWIDNFKVYSQKHSEASDDAPKDVYYQKNDVIISRDTWNSFTPVFFGAKGGFAADAHGHMDMGTFTYFADGVQWLCDYGAENYNLPGFWSGGSKDSMRWQYFAMRAEAHNCLIINPDENGEYDPMAKAKFVRYENSEDGIIAVLDMTPVHDGKAESAKRGYFFTDNRQSLVVRDEVVVSEKSDIYFFLQTAQKVSINGNTVTITSKSDSSKSITVEFACDTEFTLTSGDAVPLPTSPSPEGIMLTTGKTRIMLKTTTSDKTSITAKFTPLNINGSDIADYIKNMDSWTLEG